MGILGSSIARLMLAVLTAAIGFMTLKTQSEFWFGVLVATAFAWGLLALDAIVADAKERDRPFWGTFLLVALATLIWGFGPLSDRSIRAHHPVLPDDIAEHYNRLSGASLGFLWAQRRLFNPSDHTEAIIYDDNGKVHSRISVTYDPEGDISYERFAISLESLFKQDIAFFSSFRPNYPTHFSVTPLSIRIYLDACHLLLALLTGFITAAITSMLYAYWCRRRTREFDRLRLEIPRQTPASPPAIQAAENAAS